MTQYRWRDVFLLCTGVSLAGSYLFWSVLDSGWLVWLAPLAGGSLAGVLLGDWYSGSGAGGYSAALAGFLFVTGNFLPMGLGGAASRGLFALTLFAVVGITAGAATGYATGWYRGRGADGDGGQAGSDADGGQAGSDADGGQAGPDTDGGQTAPDGDAPSGE